MTATKMTFLGAGALFATILGLFLAAPPRPTATSGVDRPPSLAPEALPANDAGQLEARSRELIGFYHSIQLTPEQEDVKKVALGPMPAACCKNSSALTCCCPCNLSKTVWGLSHHLIAVEGADAAGVRAGVEDWMRQINPRGHDGTACYSGACGTSFGAGGCGGMSEGALTL